MTIIRVARARLVAIVSRPVTRMMLDSKTIKILKTWWRRVGVQAAVGLTLFLAVFHLMGLATPTAQDDGDQIIDTGRHAVSVLPHAMERAETSLDDRGAETKTAGGLPGGASQTGGNDAARPPGGLPPGGPPPGAGADRRAFGGIPQSAPPGSVGGWGAPSQLASSAVGGGSGGVSAPIHGAGAGPGHGRLEPTGTVAAGPPSGGQAGAAAGKEAPLVVAMLPGGGARVLGDGVAGISFAGAQPTAGSPAGGAAGREAWDVDPYGRPRPQPVRGPARPGTTPYIPPEDIALLPPPRAARAEAAATSTPLEAAGIAGGSGVTAGASGARMTGEVPESAPGAAGQPRGLLGSDGGGAWGAPGTGCAGPGSGGVAGTPGGAAGGQGAYQTGSVLGSALGASGADAAALGAQVGAPGGAGTDSRQGGRALMARVSFPGETRTGFSGLDPAGRRRHGHLVDATGLDGAELAQIPAGGGPLGTAPGGEPAGGPAAGGEVSPSAGGLPGAGESAAELNKPVSLPEMKNLDIKNLVKIIADETNQDYMFEGDLTGQVTVLGPRPVTAGEAEQLLKAILEYRGFGVQVNGHVRRIVNKSSQIRGAYVPMRTERPAQYGTDHDHLTLQIFHIRHTPLQQIVAAITPFFGLGNTSLIQYPPTNTLFVIDTDPNLERLSDLIDQIDIPLPEKRVTVVRINHSSAKVVAEKAGQVIAKLAEGAPQLQTTEAAMGKPVLIPDERTNAILLICLEQDVRSIVAVIEQFDDGQTYTPNVRVVHLQFAEAEQVSSQISQAFQVSGQESAAGFKVIADTRTQSLIISATSATMLAKLEDLAQFLDNQVIPADGVMVHHYAMKFSDATKVEKILTGLEQSSDKKSPVKVIADEVSNSLVIVAPGPKYRELLNVLKDIDTLRPQVLVEALIVSLRIDKDHEAGADLNLIPTGTNTRVFGLGSTGAIRSGLVGGASNGLHVGVIAPGSFDANAAFGANPSITELSKITYLVNLFKKDDRANILSNPQIMTADNEDAKINVGSKVQVPTGLGTTVAGGQGFVTNFTTEELGLSLNIKPRITQQDYVAMKISIEDKEQTGQNLVFSSQFQTPVFSRTSVDSNVTVRNHTVLVIGGLMSEQKERTVQKIPGVGDLPLIGRLFQSRSLKNTKSDLLIFIQPHVLRDNYTAKKVTHDVNDILQHRDLQGHTHPHEAGLPVTPETLLDDLHTGRN